MASGIRQPPTRAFMDDMTITAKSVVECRWMLEDLERLISWARMKFKPEKSRSLVLKKGKVNTRMKFKIKGEVIPTVTEKPVKSLGKWFDTSLKDTESITQMVIQGEEWMCKIDRSGLPGKYKAWCYQHGVLPRLLWPLMIYDVPFTIVEKMERKITGHLRRWLGVPQSFSSVGLYSAGSKSQLPLKALTEEYKATKARQFMMIQECTDNKVKNAGIILKTGRKWKVEQAVQQATERLEHQDIIGTTTTGRQGLGCVTRSSWKRADKAERRHLIQGEVRQEEERTRQTLAVSMRKQGAWLHWEGVRYEKLSWGKIWQMEARELSFKLKSVYDVLPSPSNLCLWGLKEDPNCKLCGKPANLEHVLSSCRTALTEGRYTWRHNMVLKEVAAGLEEARKNKKKKQLTFIKFVPAGSTESRSDRGCQGILATASDWILMADLQTQLVFPPEITVTRLRPDIVMWSRSTRNLIIIELTVPWEERMEEVNERKREKYQDLVDECKEKGWKTWCWPIEVGSRGFAGQSMWRMLKNLGIVGNQKKRLVDKTTKAAERASRWLWLRKEEQWRSYSVPGQE